MNKKRTSTPNPAKLELTAAQNKVLEALRGRQNRNRTSTSTDIAADCGYKDRTYVYRILKSLEAQGLVTIYNRRYYKLA